MPDGPYILVKPPTKDGPICFPAEGFRNEAEKLAGVILRHYMTFGEVVTILDGLYSRRANLPPKRSKVRRRALNTVITGLEERLRYATNMQAADVIKSVRESEGAQC